MGLRLFQALLGLRPRCCSSSAAAPRCTHLSRPCPSPTAAGAWLSGVNSGAPAHVPACNSPPRCGPSLLEGCSARACSQQPCIWREAWGAPSPPPAGVIMIHGAVMKTGEVVAWQTFTNGYK